MKKEKLTKNFYFFEEIISEQKNPRAIGAGAERRRSVEGEGNGGGGAFAVGLQAKRNLPVFGHDALETEAQSDIRALDLLLTDREIIPHLCDRIDELKAQGYYDGAYACVRLAAGTEK